MPNQYTTSRQYVPCRVCGKMFSIPPYRLLTQGNTCSRACHHIALIQPIAERFWSKVQKSGPDDCWPWLGVQARGYGRFWFNRRNTPAHRFAYELTYGPIADDLFACHRCDNRICVNPNHLFMGTAGENMQDASLKGRMARGEKNGFSRLTEDAVRAIRAAYIPHVVTQQQLADKYGVDRSAIGLILHHRNWAYLP